MPNNHVNSDKQCGCEPKPGGGAARGPRATEILLANLHAGRASAENEFVNKYYSRIYVLARRLLGEYGGQVSLSEVTNLAAHDGLKAIKGDDRIGKGAVVFAILKTITERRFHDARWGRKRVPTIQEAALDSDASSEGRLADAAVDHRNAAVDEAAAMKDLFEHVVRALREIAADEPHKRDVIQLYFGVHVDRAPRVTGVSPAVTDPVPEFDAKRVEQFVGLVGDETLSQRELAQELGCTPGVARTIIGQIVRDVRKRLGLDED